MFKKLKLVCSFNGTQYTVVRLGHNDRVYGVSIMEGGQVRMHNSCAYPSMSYIKCMDLETLGQTSELYLPRKAKCLEM